MNGPLARVKAAAPKPWRTYGRRSPPARLPLEVFHPLFPTQSRTEKISFRFPG